MRVEEVNPTWSPWAVYVADVKRVFSNEIGWARVAEPEDFELA